MAAFIPTGLKGIQGEVLAPGDTEMTSGASAKITTAGAGTLDANSLITGNIYRSGPGANYTDTFDTAANILAALAGNGPAGRITPGMGFTCRVTNGVAFTETLTLGAGMVAGNGSVASIAANSWRDLILSFRSIQQPITLVGNTTNGNAVVTFTLPPGQSSLPEGVVSNAVNLQVGASVSGAGISAGTTVLGITQGVGGVVGVTLSANATATGANVALTFGPTIQVDSSGSGSL